MRNHTILVLANPAEPQLSLLKQLSEAKTVVGDSTELFAEEAFEASVLFNW
jgi:hypothetical protein